MAELLRETDKRTCYCGELSVNDIGKRVCVMGWVQKQRDLGSLIFIDLRDRTGIVQLAFDENTERSIFDTAFGIRAEFVLCARGVVQRRIEHLVEKAGGVICGRMAILAEGEAADRDDLIYLEKLPLFDSEGNAL